MLQEPKPVSVDLACGWLGYVMIDLIKLALIEIG